MSASTNKSSVLLLIVFFLTFTISLFVGGFFQQLLVYASVALLGLWLVRLAITTDFLRDEADVPEGQKPFSFSRSQLAYWSYLIISGFMIIFVLNDAPADEILTNGTLILLGIGGATSAAANVIDTNEKVTAKQSNASRHQDTPSDGFFVDILSDADGISIHRLQALVFNLVFGAVLIFTIFSEGVLRDFSQNELILIGLSSGTYTILKTNENKASIAPKK